jgi:four helix bundle protein
MPFKFEKLKVWKDSVELSGLVHKICLTFPKEELFILVPEIKRAADSVSLNIAEGSTGQTSPEFKKFLGYALRSGVEVVGCIYLAKKRNIIADEDFETLYNVADQPVKRIQALRNSLN